MNRQVSRRTGALFLVFALLLALFPLPARAATVVKEGNASDDGSVTFTLTDDGTLTISGTGAMADYADASAVPWYDNRSTITTVEITAGVTSIGNSAFDWCSNLTNIIIPDSVTSIGNSAFAACSSLTSVTIPDSVTSIGNAAFIACSSLTSVIIPNSVTSIGNEAFIACSGLTSVTIPSSVTSIGDSMFSGCNSLTDVTIADAITSIESNMFEGCSSLTSIAIPNSVTYIDERAFLGCSGLRSVRIPNSVTYIRASAFNSCDGLTSVKFDGTAPAISIDAFSTSSSASSVEFLYPYGDASYDTVKDQNYGATAATWTPYGETELTASIGVSTVTDASSTTKTTTFQVSSSTIPLNTEKAADLTNYTIVGGEYALPTATPEVTFGSGNQSVTMVWTEKSNVQSRAVTEETSEFRMNVNSDILEAVTLNDLGNGQVEKVGEINIPVPLTQSTQTPDPTYTVTYTDGVSGAAFPDQTYPNLSAGGAIPSFSGTPTRTGYTFQGWNPAVAGTVTASVTYTAVWEEERAPDPPTPPSVDPTPSNPGTPSYSPSSPPLRNPRDKLPKPTESVIEELLPAIVVPPPAQDPESPIQDIVKKNERPISWVDRIDPPDYALTLYDVLVAGADEKSSAAGNHMADCLIQDKYFSIDANAQQGSAAGYEVYEIEQADFALSDLYANDAEGRNILDSVVFADDQFYMVDVSSGDHAVNYAALRLGDVIQTPVFNGIYVTKIVKDGAFDAKKKETCSYIAAVYQAFDRDHPEIFWLSGKCRARIMTVKSPEGIQEAYFFLSLADKDGFTMRAPAWTAPGAVAEGLQRRDAAVNQILANLAAGTPAEQIRQLNRWLTEHNEYNTTADLTTIGNEPHECLSALEGRIGTSGPVCDGYSRAFKVLCDRLEIPCVLENGYAKPTEGSSGTLHMWNSVQMGDAWYGADVTWNDPVVKGVSGAKSGRENERYLLVGSATEIRGMTFAVSHPATNRAATGGVSFNNGPVLSSAAFSAVSYNSGLTALPFTDVRSSDWFSDAVEYVYERGLMSGTSASTFAPQSTVTRQQVWMILARLSGERPSNMSEARAWAVRTGISDGANPDGNLSRQQMVVFLHRYAQMKGYALGSSASLADFPDRADAASYAQDALSWAVGNGVITGTAQGTLNPAGTATRAQFAVILQRFHST